MRGYGLVAAFVALIGCGPPPSAPDVEVHIDLTQPQYPGQTWHERYVADNCERCPECCSDDRQAESVFCTPDLCPGPECQCFMDPDGVWWVDATMSGTDDDEDEIECGEAEGRLEADRYPRS